MAWIITKDLADTDAVGVTGPRGVSETAIAKLERGEGFRFRMRTDDDLTYYHGLSSEADSFDPLDDFGTPNAGCTDIQYRDRRRRLFSRELIRGWTSL